MNLKENKTSGELKRDVLNELQNVRHDLDNIQGRLTPGAFIDDALFQPVGKNPRAIFDHLKTNPIGTAFLSLGTILLMEDESQVTYETSLRNRGSSVRSKVESKVGEVNQKLHGAVDNTKSKIEKFRNKFSGDENTKGAEFDFNAGGELGNSSIDANPGEIKDTAFDAIAEVKGLDPMTFMAIGAGLGALTGISLPVSETEQTMIDQKFQGKLSEFSSEFQDAINQSVQILKDEFLGKFKDFDVNLFKAKTQTNENFPSV